MSVDAGATVAANANTLADSAGAQAAAAQVPKPS